MKTIKAAASIPVISVGSIEPKDGNRLIGEGAIDFVAMGRQLLADPALPNKLIEDQLDDIRPCIVYYTCISQQVFASPVYCAINPACCHEGEVEIKKATKSKRVLVVG